MSTLKSISAALKLIDAKKEDLKKAFDDVQSQSSVVSNSIPLSWPYLDSHFTSIQTSLTQRFHLLEILTAILNGLQPSPSKSPHQTPNDAILTPLPNDPSTQNAGVFPKIYVGPSSNVMPKDTLMATIKEEPPSPSKSTSNDANLTPLPNNPSTQNVASGVVFPQNYVVPSSIVTPTVNEEPPSPSKSPNQIPNDANFTPLPNDRSIVIRHELRVLCDKMDGKGLIKYLNTRYKALDVVLAELPGALQCAADAAEMVVESLEAYRRSDKECEDNELRKLTKKQWNCLKRSCNILLKQLRVVAPNVSWKTRERALKVAREWKVMMLVDNVSTCGALSFLHFVTAYGLVSEINVDEYVKYSLMCGSLVDKKEFPELCQIAGLADRVPDIIQKLIEKGKHILAVKYIFEFNLADKISPAPILKAFADVSMKLSERLFEEGKSWTDIKNREIGALKSVINFIEKHKLEVEYPRASLDQRIEELKSQKSIMKLPAPASDANPPQDQQQLHQTPNDANLTPLPNDPSTQNAASGGVFPKNYVVPSSIVMPKDAIMATVKEEPLSLSKSPNQTSNDANLTPLPNNPSIVIRHELRVLCDKMDGKGLINYLNTHYKVLDVVLAELPGALWCAADASEMVVELLEGYHRRSDKECEDNELRKLTKKQWSWLRRSCNILLKQLRVVAPNVSWKTRERALKVAREWKVMLDDTVSTCGALSFLHFVTAYGLVSEINVDEYVKYSLICGRLVDNKEFPELCQIAGLAERVPDIIQKLIEKGKYILAVKYIFEFNLADKISPAPILKAFADVSMKLSERLVEEGKSWTDIIDREIGALKSVINFIEQHKLEVEYPRASLDQRIEELKSQKSIMKRPAPASDANPPQDQQQQQLQKTKKQKLKQQQGGINHPQDQRIEELKSQKSIMKRSAPASDTNPPQDQQQLQKTKKQKLKQQQGGINHPQTTTPVGPAAALKNVHNGNSTIHQYHQHPGHSTGVFSEHSNPYMSSPAMPFGLVGPTPIGPSVGPYGLAGIPMDPSGNASLGGSHLNSSELHVPSGHYGEASTYGRCCSVGLQHY